MHVLLTVCTFTVYVRVSGQNQAPKISVAATNNAQSTYTHRKHNTLQLQYRTTVLSVLSGGGLQLYSPPLETVVSWVV